MQVHSNLAFLALFVCFLVSSCKTRAKQSSNLQGNDTSSAVERIGYRPLLLPNDHNGEIAALISANCVTCHTSVAARKGGISFELFHPQLGFAWQADGGGSDSRWMDVDSAYRDLITDRLSGGSGIQMPLVRSSLMVGGEGGRKKLIDWFQAVKADTAGDTLNAEYDEADIKRRRESVNDLGDRIQCSTLTPSAPMEAEIAAKKHFEALPETEKASQLYFTFSHLQDSMAVKRQWGDVSLCNLNACQAAASKWLNSLSQNPEIVPLTTVDPNGFVLTLNARSLGWTSDRITKLFEKVEKLDGNGTSPMLIKGDAFLRASMKFDLYKTLTGMDRFGPDRGPIEPIEAWLNVDFNRDQNNQTIKKVGLFRSGVTYGYRLLERYTIPSGQTVSMDTADPIWSYSNSTYYWRSNDGKRLTSEDIEKKFNESPAGDLLKPAHFGGSLDAEEIIFGLPNGLQGYFIAGTGGTSRLSESEADNGDDEIVYDGTGNSLLLGYTQPNERSLLATPGSCALCHSHGMIMVRNNDVLDMATEVSVKHPGLAAAISVAYPDKTATLSILKKDQDRFVTAERKVVAKYLADPAIESNPLRLYNYPDVLRTCLEATMPVSKPQSAG